MQRSATLKYCSAPKRQATVGCSFCKDLTYLSETRNTSASEIINPGIENPKSGQMFFFLSWTSGSCRFDHLCIMETICFLQGFLTIRCLWGGGGGCMPKACTQICRAFSINFLEKQKFSWPASCRVAALFKANIQFTCYPQFQSVLGIVTFKL